jgi:glycosyltransferase involved in cell wall biosynthesis
LFVGVLERYKAVDVLVDAWRRVTGGRLRLVGVGPLQPLVDDLVRGDERVTWTPRLEQDAVVHALDEATVLLLPSRSEGLPRIVMEAFCRGRPVVGSRRGGTPDLVHDGVNGLLVDAEDGDGLARAIERVLSDAELAERLAEGARASAQEWARTPEDYAASVRELVERA